jgi:hypothetical protein
MDFFTACALPMLYVKLGFEPFSLTLSRIIGRVHGFLALFVTNTLRKLACIIIVPQLL